MSSSEQTEIRWAIEQANFEPGSNLQQKAAELLMPGAASTGDERRPDA
jgi:hypothetical protein